MAEPTAPAVISPAVLGALSLQYGRQRAELDDQQNRRRINYNSALDKMKRNLKDTQLQSREAFADRGMLHAGASLANQVKLRGEYNRGVGEMTNAYNTDLATIARRRLEAQAQYNSDRILTSLGLEV